MGGPDKVKRQHDGGKLTVRERVDRLLDPGSFHEIGGLAGVAQYGADGELADFTPANLVMGRGRIGGRPVAVTGDDFTVRGGANDGGIKNKLLAVERMACDLRLPLVRLVDGTGGGGSVKNLELQGHSPMPKAFLWDWWTDNLSEIPVVSLALGSVAGLGAARVVASHYSVMVKDTSQMFVAGPAGGGVDARQVREERARRQPHPHAQRRGGRRGGERGRGLRESAAVSLLPAQFSS